MESMTVQDYIKDAILRTREIYRAIIYYEDNKKLPFRYVYSAVQKQVKQFLINRGSNDIILLPGLRGTGKTTILYQIYEYAKDIINYRVRLEPSQILYVSMDEAHDYYGYNVWEIIQAFVEKIHGRKLHELDKKLLILLDEVHYDRNWQLHLKMFHDRNVQGNALVIATGSSAMLLNRSADIARRSRTINVPSLSFGEYLMLKSQIMGSNGSWYPKKGTRSVLRAVLQKPTEENVELLSKIAKSIEVSVIDFFESRVTDLFTEYKIIGSFPFAMKGYSIPEIHERTKDIIDRIVQVDLPKLRNFESNTLTAAKKVITYLIHAPPGPISEQSIAQALDSVSRKSVRAILDSLCASGLIYEVPPFAKAAGKAIRLPNKYYFEPTSVISAFYELTPEKLSAKEMEKVIGKLNENAAASAMYRIRLSQDNLIEMYYLPGEGMPDILLIFPTGERTIIEIGTNKNATGQLRKTGDGMGRVFVTERNEIRYKGDIAHIPLWLLAMA